MPYYDFSPLDQSRELGPLSALICDAAMATPESLNEAVRIARDFGQPLGPVLVRTRTMTEQDLAAVLEASRSIRSGSIARSEAIAVLRVANRSGLCFSEARLRVENRQRQSSSGPQAVIAGSAAQPQESGWLRDAETLNRLVETKMIDTGEAAQVVRQCVLEKRSLDSVLRQRNALESRKEAGRFSKEKILTALTLLVGILVFLA
ncbi:MAG: hypothetical protein IPM23_07450 [Candidatus Melainabacteria bacterium]|nr:hypothetical protein [Candidatus Melainabacteria bacterium]